MVHWVYSLIDIICVMSHISRDKSESLIWRVWQVTEYINCTIEVDCIVHVYTASFQSHMLRILYTQIVANFICLRCLYYRRLENSIIDLKLLCEGGGRR